MLASFCLTEPAAGSDVAAISTRAVRHGSAYRISGSKCFITNGGYADFYVVFAKTDPAAGHRGISCFLVPRDAGVVVDGHEDKMGQRASNTSSVTFPDVEIPADHLIGEENAGFRIAMATLDRTRPGAAAMATGVARAAFEFAVAYARERVQFGVPIASHQAIQFMIADMATEIDAARLLTWGSAVAVDRGDRATLVSSTPSASPPTSRCASPPTPSRSTVATATSDTRREADARREDHAALRGTAQIQRIVIAREICSRLTAGRRAAPEPRSARIGPALGCSPRRARPRPGARRRKKPPR